MLLMLAFAALLAPSQAPELTIRIVYDNQPPRQGYQSDWGFAAVVDFRGHRMIFDSGARPEPLLENLKQAGIDAASIEKLVLSHDHLDHQGGLARLRELNPKLEVYLPAGPREPQEILPGIHTTGIIDGSPSEQALVIETSKGLVVITGCSHPGVVSMLGAAVRGRANQPVRLLVGGFHMLQYSPEQIASTVARLKALRVQAIAPTHCTGPKAIEAFRAAFGKAFQPGGAGARIAF